MCLDAQEDAVDNSKKDELNLHQVLDYANGMET